MDHVALCSEKRSSLPSAVESSVSRFTYSDSILVDRCQSRHSSAWRVDSAEAVCAPTTPAAMCYVGFVLLWMTGAE